MIEQKDNLKDSYGKVLPLSFDVLNANGYMAIYRVGVGNTIWSKWGFELETHCDCIYTHASVPEKFREAAKSSYSNCAYRVRYLHELLALESLVGVDKTPDIKDLTVDQLKAMMPDGYRYVLNKRFKQGDPGNGVSFNNKKGRYKLFKGDKLVCDGFNDETEDFFLARTLLYALKTENKLPTNKDFELPVA